MNNGDVVYFDGSLSADPENDNLTYVWNFGDGSTLSGVNVNHTYAKPGTYTARLTVTDTGNLSHTDDAIITVLGTTPSPPPSGVVVVATFLAWAPSICPRGLAT